jgi:NitT/TauT family transport system ATP-binding protein
MTGKLISFENVGKVFHVDGKDRRGGVRHQPRRLARRVRDPGRPVGLRKVDAAQHDGRAAAADHRHGALWRRGITGVNLSAGYMTQSDHLLPWRTVAGNIAVPLEIKGRPREAIRARRSDA